MLDECVSLLVCVMCRDGMQFLLKQVVTRAALSGGTCDGYACGGAVGAG